MAAFFSKQSSAQGNTKAESSAPILIRTMQDDLDDIKSGRGAAHPSRSEQKKAPELAFKKEVSMTPVNPFSEAGEKVPEYQENFPRASYPPFGAANERRQASPPRPVLDNGLTSMVPEGGIVINEPKKGINKAFFVVMAVVIVMFLVAAALWYFFADVIKKKLETTPVSMPETIEQPRIALEAPLPRSLPFSVDRPNYLSINTEAVSPEDIRKTFLEVASRLQDADIAGPVEFLITDQNNNPLAFSRFAFLSDLGLDPGLLALIDETFSFYAYDDVSSVRFGLVLRMTDVQAATLNITKTESTLPHALRTIILEPDINITDNVAFQSSTYKRFSVRFLNIDSAKNISVDYALDENQWYIGTSKNTLRAILDMQKNPGATGQSSEKEVLEGRNKAQ